MRLINNKIRNQKLNECPFVIMTSTSWSKEGRTGGGNKGEEQEDEEEE